LKKIATQFLIANYELVTRICGKLVRTTDKIYFTISNPD